MMYLGCGWDPKLVTTENWSTKKPAISNGIYMFRI